MAVVAAVVAVNTWGAGIASAQSADVHCAVTLGQGKPGTHTSPVLATSCQTGATPAALGGSYPILTIYESLNYTGSSKTFYGSAPCDASGYYIDAGDKGLSFGWWRRNISSMAWGNNCSYINGYQGGNNTGFCQQYHGNVGYVGAQMNDKIWSLHIQSAWRAC